MFVRITFFPRYARSRKNWVCLTRSPKYWVSITERDVWKQISPSWYESGTALPESHRLRYKQWDNGFLFRFSVSGNLVTAESFFHNGSYVSGTYSIDQNAPSGEDYFALVDPRYGREKADFGAEIYWSTGKLKQYFPIAYSYTGRENFRQINKNKVISLDASGIDAKHLIGVKPL